MWLHVDHPELCAPHREAGYLSAYDERPTLATIAYRQDTGEIPLSLVDYDGVIAVLDCSRIGQRVLMRAGGNVYRLLVFDCAGPPPGGSEWMIANRIVGEVGYGFRMAHPELVHGWAELEYR